MLPVSIDHSNRLNPVPIGEAFVAGHLDTVADATLIATMRFLNGRLRTKSLHLVVLFAVFSEQLEQLRIQLFLILLHRENVVRFGIDDRLGRRLLAVHRVERDHRPGKIQQF